jgi:hypothetical protein
MARSSLENSLFQSFQWFDGLTMSGFILNCSLRSKPAAVQGSRFKSSKELPRFENSRNVERFAKHELEKEQLPFFSRPHPAHYVAMVQPSHDLGAVDRRPNTARPHDT